MTNSYSAKRKSKALYLFTPLCISLVLFSYKTGHSLRTPAVKHDAQTHAELASPSASEALDRLLKGNERFVADSSRQAHQSTARRKELVAAQHPFATILSCSDSRVPTELVFDQGLGDLFVVRVAGNVVATDDLGTIEYAVDHLHTPLVLVMGHESCGAVTGALLPEAERNKESKDIQALLALILPALKGIDPKLSLAERVSRGVELNVRWSIQQLQDTPDLKEKIADGRLRIVGGVYDLETGKVRLLK
jgi:carbonic anhydrase